MIKAPMQRTNSLLGITLGGFQTFESPTFIPLSGLTMFFGPNSAGKSAVQDGIEMYQKLCSLNSDQWETNDVVIQMVKRHARHPRGTNPFARPLQFDMKIAVKHTAPRALDSLVSKFTHKKIHDSAVPNVPSDIELGWVFLPHYEKSEDPEVDPPLLIGVQFNFFIDGVVLCRMRDNGLWINLENPFLKNFKRTFQSSDLVKDDGDEFGDGSDTCFIDGVNKFTAQGLVLDPKGAWSWFRYFNSTNFSKDSPRSAFTMMPATEELVALVGSILKLCVGDAEFRATSVVASRNVPTRPGMRFHFGVSTDQLDESQISAVGVSLFRGLADSLASELTSQHLKKLNSFEKHQQFGKSVNRALTDHLFLEQGYRIDYDFRVLLSKSNSLAAIQGKSLNATDFGYIVELHLRDTNSRKHYFEDVGSGIGYVLPVLCALYDPEEYSVCFIQQPELHLHPALQAELGDVFIEAMHANRTTVVETHSEHLLLRILKRVRQTHLKASIAEELKISANEVCVLYFNPVPGGETVVKRLRVSEDGEFMDRWPKGFFAERDQELLDE